MPHVSLISSLLLSSLVPAAAAQSGPDCLATDFDGNDAHYLWGGEMRQIFTLDTGAGEHTWIVGDGGQIRHRLDTGGGGSNVWEFQDTPDSLRTTLLDVHFLNEGDGWVCGWGGRVLKTTDGGGTWTDHPGTPILNCQMDPAVLWRSRFVDDDLGFTCGLWTFKRWDGAAWSNVTLLSGVGSGATTYSPGWIEFYALAILQTEEGWIGVAAGQEWIGSGHCANENFTPGKALVFYTDSRMELSANGQVWWRTFDQAVYENRHETEVFVDDPWDLEYAPDSTDLDEAILYLAGGRGIADGSIFRSSDGGRTFPNWSLDFGAPNAQGSSPTLTLYGVAALENGGAMACGYGGNLWTRIPGGSGSPPTWENAKGPPNFSGPLADAHAFVGDGDGDNCLVVGSWGFVRETQNASDPTNGVSWTVVNPGDVGNRKKHFRLEDIAFLDEETGYAVGQFQVLARTTNGGCSWTATATNSPIPNGPPSGPAGKMLALAFNAGGSLGIAVGRADLSDSAQSACYVYDATLPQPHSWQTFWSEVDLSGLLGGIKVELTGATAVDSTTFLAVGTKTSGGTTPLVLLGLYDTANHQLTWLDVTPTITTSFPSNLKLSDVHAINPTEAFAVGYSDSNTPRAYLVQIGASTTFTTITVSGSGRLTEVSANGDNRFLDDIIAVGSPNLVLKYDPAGTAGTFVGFSPSPPPSELAFTSIAMFGDIILVGQDAQASALAAADGGRLLRYDGSSWEILKSLTCEAIPAIFLLDETTGWFLGDGGELDTEFGTVGDTMVLYYSASGN